MDKTLQQIANTIVANLGNTEATGLFDGKLGISLFLYRYSRYSGYAIYEDIASDLLDDVFKELKPYMSPSVIDGMASIGFGLSILLKECFLEGDPDDDVLRDIDEALLNNVKASFLREINYPIPLYSSGIYLLSRIPYHEVDVENRWISNIIFNATDFITKIKKKDRLPKLSLFNSMLFIFEQLYEGGMNTSVTETLLKDLLKLSAISVESDECSKVDLFLFRQNIDRFPKKIKEECMQTIKQLRYITEFSDNISMETWYENLWWGVLYDIPVLANISMEEVILFIKNKIQESYFDETVVNSKLAAVGLLLMLNK